MSTTEDRSSDTGGTATAETVDKKLEVVVIPVSDAERAKDWPHWHARYMVAEQAGTELPK